MPSTAIKVNSNLADQARQAADVAHRSMTGQLEYWARLGRSMEPLFTPPTIAALQKSGGDPDSLDDPKERALVLEAFSKFRALPQDALREKLNLDQKIVIEPDPSSKGKFVRIYPNGRRERGVIQGREFVPE